MKTVFYDPLPAICSRFLFRIRKTPEPEIADAMCSDSKSSNKALYSRLNLKHSTDILIQT